MVAFVDYDTSMTNVTCFNSDMSAVDSQVTIEFESEKKIVLGF